MAPDETAGSSPPTAKPSHMRRTYLVDRAFQIKYTVGMMAFGGLLVAFFGYWMYDAHRQALEVLSLNKPLDMASLKELATKSSTNLLYVIIGIALLMISALGLFGVVITHRVSGPVYVMSHYLAMLAQGRYPRMRALRKTDELKAFFEVFQNAVAAMRERDEKEATAIEDAVARMTPAASKAPEVQPALDELAQVARRKRAEVSGG